jgi:ubiquinone/menaquinone biosynthesis C-methylase UbiE
VNLFEKFIKKYSKIKVNRILDIACGPSLQLREIAERGYQAIGLDLSVEMLDYLNQKSKEKNSNCKRSERIRQTFLCGKK